jgi:malonyl-CoA O-methyltransferase
MRRPSQLPNASIALPEPGAARRGFDAAAQTFDSACAAHDRAREILLDRLRWFDLAPRRILDVACGSGRGSAVLMQQYPQAQVLAVDSSHAMLCAAASARAMPMLACCDAQSLPVRDHSVDLLLANLVLPWCDPQMLLREFSRALAPGGLLLASTTGPATLQEVRRAWRSVDTDVHVHAAFDMQTLGDLCLQAGLHEPVLDADRLTLRYSTPERLHAELRASGAGNAARGRRGTLTGTERFRRYADALAHEAGVAGGIDVTVEFIYVQAWGATDRLAQAPPEPRFHGIPLRRE